MKKVAEGRFKIRIEKLVYGGDGLAHQDGATVFAPYLLPGEEAYIAPVEQKKHFIRGRVREITLASPERIAPACPHFTICGGCHYQHIPYAAQIQYKSDILRETLRRLAHLDWQDEITAHPSPPWEYRNRAQWKFRPAEASRGAQLQMGYFRGRSTSLCPIERCPILAPALTDTLHRLKGAAAEGKLPRTLREIEAFVDDRGASQLLNGQLSEFPESPEALADLLGGIVTAASSILLQAEEDAPAHVRGPGYITTRAAGHDYRVSHLSFFQVNRFLLDELAAVVVAAAGQISSGSVFDLYAGSGFFALPLAARFGRVVAVESNPSSSQDLAANTSSLTNLQVLGIPVEEFLQSSPERPDAVLLDPPRAGLSTEACRLLDALQPARIVYLSCDPATLARDLTSLISSGYGVRTVEFFDMFPQSFHIESLVTLEKLP